jgi:hypothetical protein
VSVCEFVRRFVCVCVGGVCVRVRHVGGGETSTMNADFNKHNRIIGLDFNE